MNVNRCMNTNVNKQNGYLETSNQLWRLDWFNYFIILQKERRNWWSEDWQDCLSRLWERSGPCPWQPTGGGCWTDSVKKEKQVSVSLSQLHDTTWSLIHIWEMIFIFYYSRWFAVNIQIPATMLAEMTSKAIKAQKIFSKYFPLYSEFLQHRFTPFVSRWFSPEGWSLFLWRR